MTDEIYRRRQLHEEASHRACEAAEELARAANSGMITGPGAYAILGHVKLLLDHLTEVTSHLPDGLQTSVHDENITITRLADGHHGWSCSNSVDQSSTSTRRPEGHTQHV